MLQAEQRCLRSACSLKGALYSFQKEIQKLRKIKFTILIRLLYKLMTIHNWTCLPQRKIRSPEFSLRRGRWQGPANINSCFPIQENWLSLTSGNTLVISTSSNPTSLSLKSVCVLTLFDHENKDGKFVLARKSVMILLFWFKISSQKLHSAPLKTSAVYCLGFKPTT